MWWRRRPRPPPSRSSNAREALAAIGGPAIAGWALAASRGLALLLQAAAFAVLGSVSLIISRGRRGVARRRPSPRPSAPLRATLHRAGRAIRSPRIHAGSLFYAQINLTLAGLDLLALLVSRAHGAGPAGIGRAFAIIGAGAIIGALVDAGLRRRLPIGIRALTGPWLTVAVVPLLIVCRSAVAVGVVTATVFLSAALSSSALLDRPLVLTADALYRPEQAHRELLAGATCWLGPLAIGIVFEHAGEVAATLVLCGWSLVVAASATVWAAVSRCPSSG